jgi:hypothetical protein
MGRVGRSSAVTLDPSIGLITASLEKVIISNSISGDTSTQYYQELEVVKCSMTSNFAEIENSLK